MVGPTTYWHTGTCHAGKLAVALQCYIYPTEVDFLGKFQKRILKDFVSMMISTYGACIFPESEASTVGWFCASFVTNDNVKNDNVTNVTNDLSVLKTEFSYF